MTHDELRADPTKRMDGSHLSFAARDSDCADSRVNVLGNESHGSLREFVRDEAATRDERQEKTRRPVVRRAFELAADRPLAHHVRRLEQLAQAVVGATPDLELAGRDQLELMRLGEPRALVGGMLHVV